MGLAWPALAAGQAQAETLDGAVAHPVNQLYIFLTVFFFVASVGLAVALRTQWYRRNVAEARARTARARARLQLEHSPDLVCVLDAKAGDRFPITWSNPAMRAFLDRRIIGAGDLGTRHPPDIAAEIAARYRRVVDTGEATRWRQVYPLGEHERLHFDIIVVPLRANDGTIDCLLATSRDVTALVEAEARQRETQLMEGLDQVTAGVAHDFNNLLQAQMTSLELVVTRSADRPPVRDLAISALRMCERGARLTNSLLSFSRRQDLRPAPVDVPSFLKQAATLLSRHVHRPVLVELQVGTTLPPLMADPAQLMEALQRLAANAAEAMLPDGRIVLGARSDRASIAVSRPDAPLPAGSYVVVEMIDQGHGMTPEILARATEPFFTTKGPGGSGLGLSMVHGFARQSGGGLRLFSQAGQGTKAELWLPAVAATQPQVPDAAAVTPLPASGQPMRVLLVEDEPDVRVAVAAFMQDAGLSVRTASHAAEALALLDDDPELHVLVTDHAMPGMSGTELVRRLRQTRPTMRAVVITGLTEAVQALDEVDGVAVLAKPFRQAALLSLVMNGASRSSARGSAARNT